MKILEIEITCFYKSKGQICLESQKTGTITDQHNKGNIPSHPEERGGTFNTHLKDLSILGSGPLFCDTIHSVNTNVQIIFSPLLSHCGNWSLGNNAKIANILIGF